MSIIDTLGIAPGSRIVCPTQIVEPEWIDYNGHLNMAFYHVMFDRAVDHVYDALGIGAEYAASGRGSCFTMEVHVHYLQELSVEDDVDIHFQLLNYDGKRLHFFEQMFHKQDGFIAATSEQIGMHVDMQTRRSAPFPAEVTEQLNSIFSIHQNLEHPPQVGHVIGIPPPKA
ncbi:MAG: thioesterase family protein [Pseudomonadota bacterium]